MFRRRKKDQHHIAPVAEEPAVLLPVEAVFSYGGWHPRTALHLQEVYDFLANMPEKGWVSDGHLAAARHKLEIVSVARQAGYLEYVRAVTASGVEIRFYEDGLYVLEVSSNNPQRAIKFLKEYHQERFSPALGALFSIGLSQAELLPQAEIDQDKGLIVSLHWPHPNRFELDQSFGTVLSKISSEDVAVYKTADLIFVVSSLHGSTMIRDLLEMQLFFSQFQSQLHLLLQQYRQVWSDTALVAERRHLKPNQLNKARSVLFQLRKSATLSQGRLQQMAMPLQTRSEIAQQLELDQHLLQLFHYRFEVLEDSLNYLEWNWKMAIDYIEQTNALVGSLTDRVGRTLNAWTFALLFLLLASSLAGWLVSGKVLSVDHGNFMSLLGVILIGGGIFWLVAVMIQHQEFTLRYPLPKRTVHPPQSQTVVAKKSKSKQSKKKAAS